MQHFVVQGPDAQDRYAFSDGKGSMWSWGVDCVTTGAAWETYDTQNRAYAAFQHYSNAAEWVRRTVHDLRDWGFNSLGGWSDTELFDKYAAGDKLPYFVVLHLGSYDKAPWNDMFRTEFEKLMDGAAKDLVPKYVDDPKLVGYFSDNELGWWGDSLFLSYFKMPADSPGKKALVEVLKKTYGGDFAAFQTDWICSANGFDELGKAAEIRIRPGGHGGAAIDAWLRALGKRYYSVVYSAIRRYDKSHLILGDRYIQYYNPAIAESSAPYVDVASTNLGADWTDGSISHFFLDTLHRATGKPVIITEFYMCAMENRSGNANSSDGFPVVQTQAQRSAAFERYVRHVASLPYVVGAHWFQFTDEPEKGRGDGEDYNMGLVDIHGRPYEGMVEACRSLDLTDIRAHAAEPAEVAKVPVPAVPADVLKDLKGWNRDLGFVPCDSKLPVADLYAARDKRYLYLGLYSMDYMDESIYEGGKVPEEERSHWTIQLGDSRPVSIRFGGKDQKPSCSDPAIEISEVPGLRYTVIARIPLPTGTSITLDSEFATHSREHTVSWSKPLELNR